MRVERLIALLVIGPLCAGCGATSTLKPRAVGAAPIAWISVTPTPYIPPTPLAAVIPPGTPACDATGLVAAFAGTGALTGGQLMGTIRIGNRTGSLCYLEGFPQVRLFDSAGRPIALQVSAWTEPKPERIPIQPMTTTLGGDSLPVGTASVSMIWPTHDFATGTCSPPAPQGTMLVLSLPSGGGDLSVPIIDRLNGNTIASCGGSLSLGPFEAAPAPTPTAPPARFSIALDLPASVAAGQTLHYIVRLRNITALPITFDRPCPTYGEWGAGAKSFYVLNCDPVRTIESGQEVAFAMQLDLPGGLSPGPSTIFWNFTGPDQLNQLPGRATIQVTH